MFRRPVALVITFAVLLAACGGSESADRAKPSGTKPDAAAAKLLAERDAFLELSASEQEQRIAELSAAKVERELFVESGLEEALGGPTATDAAFEAATSGLNSRFEELRSDPPAPTDFKPARAPAPADEPNLGGVLFGGLVGIPLLTSAAISITKDETVAPASLDMAKDNEHKDSGGKGSMDLSGSAEAVKVGINANISAKGLTEKLKANMDLTTCPDANGDFTGTVKLEMSATADGTNTGQAGTMDVKFVGHVGDDAKVSGMDLTTRMQYGKFANSKGGFFDYTIKSPYGKSSVTPSVVVNRTGGTVTDSLVASATALGNWIGTVLAIQVADQAEKGWQDGRCVTLETITSPAKRTGLKPLTKVKITASPRSKKGGGPVGGTVTATLTGASAVDPAGTPVPADASFTYTAPGEKKASGSVSLVSLSKQGGAKATLSFSTEGPTVYVASGGGGRITITGTVEDITSPFTLQGVFAGGKATLSFTPSDETGGSYSYSGGGSGVTVSGGGTYTVSGTPGEVLTLKYSGNGCAKPVGGCSPTKATVTLTPKT